MSANYLRAICLSMIFWTVFCKPLIAAQSMPSKLYFNRVLSIVSWKIDHLEEPLQQLKTMRQNLNLIIKCSQKPQLKSCQPMTISSAQLHTINHYLLGHEIPNRWMHWNYSSDLEKYLSEVDNSQLENLLLGTLKTPFEIDPDVLKMQVLAERVVRFLTHKYRFRKANQLNEIPWWYYLAIFIMILSCLIFYSRSESFVDNSFETNCTRKH